LTKSTDAILDSGTSLTYIPTGEYQTVFNYVTMGRTCSVISEYYFCTCTSANDTTYPTIYLTLGG